MMFFIGIFLGAWYFAGWAAALKLAGICLAGWLAFILVYCFIGIVGSDSPRAR